MLFPKKVKHRKWQKMSSDIKGVAQRGTTLAFGSHALKAQEGANISSAQIEACRRAITRTMQKGGKLWIRIFPDKPVTRKPSEVRMGKGKGDPVGFVAVVKKGRILFELDGVPDNIARKALRRAADKLPLKTKIISRK